MNKIDLNNHLVNKAFLNWSLFICWLLNFLQHLPSFFRSTFTGDEKVYLSLSRSIGWDLSNFTTMYDPNISQWPNTIYRSPLFHHGPLYPYVLKIGSVFSSPATLGFIFSNLVVVLFLLHLRRLHDRLNVPPILQILVYVFVSIAPLLLFSTTRLHIDAITGMLIASGFIATIEALERNSIKWGLWAGLLLSISLNTGFTAILLIPVFICFQLYHLYNKNYSIKNQENDKESVRIFNIQNWKIFSIIAFIVFTLGMLHYVRLFYTYGTILPSGFVKNEGGGYFLNYINSISNFWMFFNILFLIPILFVIVFPETYRILLLKLKNKDWGAVIFVSFIFIFFMVLFLSGKEARRFANATPLFYCCLGWLLSNYNKKYVTILFGVILFSFFSMTSSAYREVVVRPNEVYKIISPTFQFSNVIGKLHKVGQSPKNQRRVILPNDKKINSLPKDVNSYSVTELINLSYKYYKNAMYLECIEVCYKVIEKDPNNHIAYNNICSSYNNLNEYQKAINACEKSIEINPEFTTAINNLKYAKQKVEF